MGSRWVRILGLRLRTLFRRSEVERELDEELEYHLWRQTEENIRLGMPPGKARREALRALGGLDQRKEQVRDTRGMRWLEELVRDTGLALRNVRRSPGFAATVVLTLALGIGANTAMFTLLSGTLLRPLPNRDADRLLHLRQSAPGAAKESTLFSVPEVEGYRTATTTLEALAESSSMVPFTLLDRTRDPVRVRPAIVSGNYFEVLGLEPALGRLTTSADDGPAADPVVVLTHRFWSVHYGGDPSVVGRAVRINDRAATVIGVVQAAPHYPGRPDVFVNMVTSPHHLSATMVTERTHRMTELFARLAPDHTLEQAREEIGRIASAMAADHPEAYEEAAGYTVTVSTLRDALNERASLSFWLLMAAAAFVLLIACANVSNLTLMRGIGREREMRVRAALGARRGRLRRLLIAENLVLAVLGGALGVLVAFAGVEMLVAFAARLSPRAAEIRVDGLVLAVALATSVVVAVGLSFVPRLGGEGGLAASLAGGSRRVTLGRGRQHFQRSLVVAQIAVSAMLLTGAGLLVRTLAELQAVDAGVHEADRVLTVELPLDGPVDESIVLRSAEHLAAYERMRDRIAALPGVRVAALGSLAPLRRSIVDFDVRAEGREPEPDRPTPHAMWKTVDPDWFAAAGIPVLAGRVFQRTDRAGTARVVVLSESLARLLFGDEDPIGRRVAWTGEVLKFSPISGEWRTVVGVVGDTRDHGLEHDPVPILYQPFAQEPVLGASLVVRTSGDPATIQPALVRAIREMNPRQLIENVVTLGQIRGEAVAPRRLNALFVTSFSGLALVIAMVGIAGVLAFSVTSRTPEIGVRMSIGADAGDVRRMVLREGAFLLALGVGGGVLGSLLVGGLLRGLLFGVAPRDPVTLTAAAALLAAVGLAACWLPAARAARIDPAVALRSE